MACSHTTLRFYSHRSPPTGRHSLAPARSLLLLLLVPTKVSVSFSTAIRTNHACQSFSFGSVYPQQYVTLHCVTCRFFTASSSSNARLLYSPIRSCDAAVSDLINTRTTMTSWTRLSVQVAQLELFRDRQAPGPGAGGLPRSPGLPSRSTPPSGSLGGERVAFSFRVSCLAMISLSLDLSKRPTHRIRCSARQFILPAVFRNPWSTAGEWTQDTYQYSTVSECNHSHRPLIFLCSHCLTLRSAAAKICYCPSGFQFLIAAVGGLWR